MTLTYSLKLSWDFSEMPIKPFQNSSKAHGICLIRNMTGYRGSRKHILDWVDKPEKDTTLCTSLVPGLFPRPSPETLKPEPGDDAFGQECMKQQPQGRRSGIPMEGNYCRGHKEVLFFGE